MSLPDLPKLHPAIRAYWEQQGFVVCPGTFIWFVEKEENGRSKFKGTIAFADSGKLKYRLNEEDYSETEALRMIQLTVFW
jgi:hypothetical protein